jgi:hypothetical protein
MWWRSTSASVREGGGSVPLLYFDSVGKNQRVAPGGDHRALNYGPLKDVAGFAVDNVALDATKAATPSRLVLIDTAELGWQRARCRSRAHRLTPADPVLVGLNTLQQWLWQRLQIPIETAHA